jgi:hypothetical protein
MHYYPAKKFPVQYSLQDRRPATGAAAENPASPIHRAAAMSPPYRRRHFTRVGNYVGAAARFVWGCVATLAGAAALVLVAACVAWVLLWEWVCGMRPEGDES